MSKEVFAIASCRVSSPEQLENNSLSRQQDNVLKASEELGAPILKYWSGNVSSKHGTNVNRTDIKQMIDFCKQHKQVKYLIVDEPDRFMRSIEEGIYFEMVFHQLDVKVWYASDPVLNGNNLSAKLLKFSKYFSAEGSNEERIHKSISGQTTALNAGRYPFSPKPGYKRGAKAGIPEIHPVRGPILRDVLTRISEHSVTPTQGLIELNKSDYTLERAPLKMDKFRKIATDSFNAGITEIDKQVKVRNEGAIHEPLITLEKYHELVRIFTAKKKNQSGPRKNGNPKFPLNRITSHDTCLEVKNKGKFVGFDHGNGKNPNLLYETYRCRSCGLCLSRAELHSKVVQLFEKNLITNEGTKVFLEVLDTVWKSKEAQARQNSVRISQQITALNDDINNRAIAAIDPSNATIKSEILTNIGKMKVQVQELDEELSGLTQKMDADKERFIKFALNFISSMGENFLTISQENRDKCKQIVFPAGFYLDTEKNVYTPEISSLIRYVPNKKDLSEPEKSLLVRSLDKRWNTFVSSVRLLAQRLESLGLIYQDGKVTYLEDNNV